MALQKKSFSDIITFSRSTEATRYNASGLIELVPANTPRFDYDPLTKMARGLLVEETRTNLILRSEDFLNNWTNTGQFLAITPASSNGPRGANTMTKFARTDIAVRYTSQSFSTPAGSVATASIYAKAAETGGFLSIRIQATYPNRIDAWFNLTTGECGFGLVGEMSGGSVSAENIGGGVWRCIATATPSTTAANQIMFTPADAPGKQVDTLPAVMSDVYVDAVQLETGAFATSYIPTTTSQVTRTTDTAKVNTLSPWYNQNEGTLYVEGKSYAPGSVLQEYVSLRGAENYHGVRLINETMGSKLLIRDEDGPDVSIIHAGRYLDTKRAAGIKPGDYAYASGGALLRNTTTEAVNPTRLEIGRGPAAGFCGHIRAIRYYPRRLTNAELQALTT